MSHLFRRLAFRSLPSLRAAESQFLTIIIPSLYRLVPIRSVSGGEG